MVAQMTSSFLMVHSPDHWGTGDRVQSDVLGFFCFPEGSSVAASSSSAADFRFVPVAPIEDPPNGIQNKQVE